MSGLTDIILCFMCFGLGSFLGLQDGRLQGKDKVIEEKKVCAESKDAGIEFKKCWKLVEI